MLIDLTVDKTIEIAAPVARVWEAMTRPELISQYFFNTEVVTTWEPGTPLIFQGEFNGQSYQDKGEILQFVPQKTIQYSYWSGFSGLADLPENYSTVTYQVEGGPDKTTVHLTQKGFANETGYQHSQTGWEAVLQGMKSLLEK